MYRAFLKISDTDDMPRYLCPTCSEMLYKFKDFKDTCIKSDEHLRKITFTTFKQELDESCPINPEPVFESVKVENESCDEDDEENAPKAMTKKERRSNRRKVSKRKRKSFDEKKDGESSSTAKLETMVSSGESDEEWNEPLKKKDKSAQSSSKAEASYQRLHRCKISNCRKCYRTEAMLEAHMKTHEGIDVRR
jgi:hypothetical protein